MVRAAAYIANIANIKDACVGTDSTGTRYCGRMIPTMEKPLATRTLIAVTTEASRNAVIVVIDSSLWGLSLSAVSLRVIRGHKNILHKSFKRCRRAVLLRTSFLCNEESPIDGLEHLDVHGGFLRRKAH